MHRRAFLAAASATTAFGLAGCSDSDSSPTDDPESVAEAFMEPDTDDPESLLHPASPHRGQMGDGEGEGDESVPDIDVSTQLLAEDLGAAELEQRFEIAANLAETIAGTDNAVVEAAANPDNPPNLEFLVATHEGDWLVVVFVPSS